MQSCLFYHAPLLIFFPLYEDNTFAWFTVICARIFLTPQTPYMRLLLNWQTGNWREKALRQLELRKNLLSNLKNTLPLLGKDPLFLLWDLQKTLFRLKCYSAPNLDLFRTKRPPSFYVCKI